MKYHSNYYILEYWNKLTKTFVECSSNKNIEWLRKSAKKSYYNYPYMGKKRIRYIQSTVIWTSK